MAKLTKLLLPVCIIGATVLVANFISANPPESKRRATSKAAQMTVEVLPLTAQSYPVVIESYGTVQPQTQSALVSQVSGQITHINEQFREGGFFEKGQVLVELDDRDYKAEVKVARAGLLSAQQTLLEEQARAEQAKIDWQRLNSDKPANDLVLRKPQLEAAKAKVLSAQAQLEKAELALERTKVTAPYSGRILSKSVDVGQVITSNTKLADIYATDYVEIRLPIKNKDLSLVSLPEEYRNSQTATKQQPVTFTSDLIGSQQWQGNLVRTEGAIDTDSQQLYVVAKIDEPFTKSNQKAGNVSIKIGQYVTAEIPGLTLESALVIPNRAIYQGSYVYLVKDGLLKRTDIEVRWQNGEEAIISSGLEEGDNVVISPLGQVSSGTPVSILGENKSRHSKGERQAQAGPGKGKRAKRQKPENAGARS